MNAFRHLLLARGGSPPIGTWVMSASPIVAEAVGTAGFDWGVLDMTQVPMGGLPPRASRRCRKAFMACAFSR